MSAYNDAETLPAAIESILNQTFTEFEFIIVDDHSSDDSWKVIQEYAAKDARIVALRNDQNLNICGALNRGISRARTPYIVRMDADDTSELKRLEVQHAFMEAHPDVVISGGTIMTCDEQLQPISERQYLLSNAEIRHKLFRYSPFCHATTIYRTADFNQAGGYNPDLASAEDYDLYFRLGRLGKLANVREHLYNVRFHGASISASQSRRQEKATLYIRLKAVAEYGYRMTAGDKLYLAAQYLSMFIIPQAWKLRLFNYFRNRKKPAAA